MKSILENILVRDFQKDWTLKDVVDNYEEDIFDYLWEMKGYSWEYGQIDNPGGDL